MRYAAGSVTHGHDRAGKTLDSVEVGRACADVGHDIRDADHQGAMTAG